MQSKTFNLSISWKVFFPLEGPDGLEAHLASKRGRHKRGIGGRHNALEPKVRLQCCRVLMGFETVLCVLVFLLKMFFYCQMGFLLCAGNAVGHVEGRRVAACQRIVGSGKEEQA